MKGYSLEVSSMNKSVRLIVSAFLAVALVALLILFTVKEGDTVSAEKEPLWSYSDGGETFSVSVSEDGEYIAAGHGDDLCLFSKEPC